MIYRVGEEELLPVSVVGETGVEIEKIVEAVMNAFEDGFMPYKETLYYTAKTNDYKIYELIELTEEELDELDYDVLVFFVEGKYYTAIEEEHYSK